MAVCLFCCCGCWCCYRNKGTTQVCCSLLCHSIGRTGHCLQAGKDLDRRPVGRPEQSVNLRAAGWLHPPQDMEKNGLDGRKAVT